MRAKLVSLLADDLSPRAFVASELGRSPPRMSR
jgi:hypothetical protein